MKYAGEIKRYMKIKNEYKISCIFDLKNQLIRFRYPPPSSQPPPPPPSPQRKRDLLNLKKTLNFFTKF